MFDKSVLMLASSSGTQSSISVKEYKAPTDESIRLCQEIEEKLFKKIVSAFEATNNVFTVTGLVLTTEPFDFSMECTLITKFLLNNNEFTIKEKIKRLMLANPEEIVHSVVKQLANVLAVELLKKMEPTEFKKFGV